MIKPYENDLLDELEESLLEPKIPFLSYVLFPRVLMKYGKENLALDLISSLGDFQTIEGSIKYDGIHHSPSYFLYALSSLFYSLENRKKLKSFKRVIRKSLLYLEQHLDSQYLLFRKFDEETFSFYDQIYFLASCNELSDAFNDIGLIKEADRIFMLKGKVELGVKRYLTQKSSFVTFFSPASQNLIISSKEETLEIITLLKYEVPSEFDAHFFLDKYNPNTLLGRILYTQAKNISFNKKETLDSKTFYFVKKGATDLLTKSQTKEYKQQFRSLFFEEAPIITHKQESLVGIKNGNRDKIITHTLEVLYESNK